MGGQRNEPTLGLKAPGRLKLRTIFKLGSQNPGGGKRSRGYAAAPFSRAKLLHSQTLPAAKPPRRALTRNISRSYNTTPPCQRLTRAPIAMSDFLAALLPPGYLTNACNRSGVIQDEQMHSAIGHVDLTS